MSRRLILFLFVALAVGFSWTSGTAQTVIENHYLVYEVPEVYTFTGQIAISDQFGLFCLETVELDKFATPVEKNAEPMVDPTVHQTWWSLYDPQSSWWTTINNQFGEQTWEVKDGRYLVLPALKDTPGTPPLFNHYKCYDAVGPRVDIPVTLVDQFGTYSMIATEVVLFCNPAEKCVDGVTYPWVDPEAHLACYLLEPPTSFGGSAMAYDQFGDWQLTILEPCWLCLPTEKLQTVPTEPTTWGKIKSLYSK
ncbi:MAG: hypothetical protein JSW58_08100 [Candidatus Latescibacterota bacterium]|nr:MAG: hypothetical protein JSW58_08100 [Candidatus Latescibacterota bacterium]